MIVSGKFIRFWWRLSLLFAIASLYGGVVGCTRDLPDPGQFFQVKNGGEEPSQPQQPSQPQTPSEPQQPVQTDPQPQTPSEPQQPVQTDPQPQTPSEPQQPVQTDPQPQTPSEPQQPDDPQQPEDPQQPPQPEVSVTDTTFLAWLLWNYDSNKDGSLGGSEAEAITKIELSTDNISTLEGIQGFPNLNYLHAQGTRKDEKNYGKLTQVDLTGNPKLQHIHLIHNHISKLNLGEQPDLDYLGLDYNEVTEIDVKSFTKLTLLQVSYNKLKTIDVSGLDILDEFHCADNPLETITLSNPKLVSFRCAGTLIKELDLSKCPKINNLDCSNCPNLTTIKIAKGQVIGNITKDDKAKFEYYE